MPYGYKKFLFKQGKSERTVNDYIAVIEQFFTYIDKQHKEPLEVFELQTRHIRSFLIKKQKEDNIKITTLNKNLSILKSFFNFLWESGNIPIDPTSKMKHYKSDKNKVIYLRYEMLQELLPLVINNQGYSNYKKIIFILAVYGFRIKDYHILKDNVFINKESVVIIPRVHEPIELFKDEAEIFLNVFDQSLFHGSEFVFVTKKHDGNFVPIEVMSVHKHLKDIQLDYNLPNNLTPNTIRHVYAFYLYHCKNLSFEDIARILGIENISAAILVKESINRMKTSKTLEN